KHQQSLNRGLGPSAADAKDRHPPLRMTLKGEAAKPPSSYPRANEVSDSGLMRFPSHKKKTKYSYST
ncbi:MAG: hypothetical protein FWE65_03365, partial [Eggerthellaceae bacterium]|nr:hypothetical protein [Eggerthellaceae bacterium]